MTKVTDTPSFIKKATEVHQGRFDYSKTNYHRSAIPVIIICPEHGEFSQRPNNHLNGSGCPKCGRKAGTKARSFTQKEFMKRVLEAHGDRYDFSITRYKNANTDVQIICPDHGEVSVRAARLMEGTGCPRCGALQRASHRLKDHSWFSERASTVHKGKFQYPDPYRGTHTPVIIICPEHGEFSQRPSVHLRGAGCPTCANVERYTPSRYLEEAKEVHQGKYKYLSPYTKAKDKIAIKCPTHGKFWQEANSHLRGHGCPSCSYTISQGELEVYNFLKELVGDEVEGQFSLEGFSYDIKVKDILIEYQGLWWHSTAVLSQKEARNKHKHKRLLAEQHGYRYVAIYEDEWALGQPKIKTYLRALVGEAEKGQARRKEVREVSLQEARDFYNAHHLLNAGTVNGRHMALIDSQGNIAACMSVGPSREVRGENSLYSLSRFCTDGRSIAGAASRLLAAFGPLPELISYVDLDKFTGSVYKTLGFEVERELAPDYWITERTKDAPIRIRRHKSNARRSLLAKREGFDPNKSEFENCKTFDIHRIFHSGRLRVKRSEIV